ncbi:fiber [California sea lion adenovirus 1]|uniref:Fiber n=1 Tax=California sea lion adenovirus 1 TaxID=943083 RepID=A0A059XNA5_9ADEN|nr:fiber [California sea lion adenovirus 1]AIA22368.1 fiber [California sea lion adenovirus 1]
MKRALPDGFNPVYPYDVKRINLMPPFFNNHGFIEGPAGVLSLNIAPPMDFDEKKQLTLKLGDGLGVNNSGELTSVNPKLNVNPPLKYIKNALSINLGNGLKESNEALSIKSQVPLEVNEQGISLKCAPELTTENGKLKLNVGNGLIIKENKVQINYGEGLEIKNSQLVSISKPLPLPDYTLWTTPDPNTNVTFAGENTPSAKLTLSLTRIGAIVIGNFSINGKYITESTPLSINMYFDAYGKLLKGSGLSSSLWGFKYNNTIDINSKLDPVKLMPNIVSYPRKISNPSSFIYLKAILEQNPSKISDIRIGLNNLINPLAVYGIEITFYFGNIKNVSLSTDTLSFSYLAQDSTPENLFDINPSIFNNQPHENEPGSEKVEPEPEKVEPEPEPAEPEKVEAEPEPAEPEKVEPEPEKVEAEPEPAEPEKVEPEPEKVEPEPEPAEPEKVEAEPEPAEPEKVEPEPEKVEAEPEPAEPEKVEPEPEKVEAEPEPAEPEKEEPESEPEDMETNSQNSSESENIDVEIEDDESKKESEGENNDAENESEESDSENMEIENENSIDEKNPPTNDPEEKIINNPSHPTPMTTPSIPDNVVDNEDENYVVLLPPSINN